MAHCCFAQANDTHLGAAPPAQRSKNYDVSSETWAGQEIFRSEKVLNKWRKIISPLEVILEP